MVINIFTKIWEIFCFIQSATFLLFNMLDFLNIFNILKKSQSQEPSAILEFSTPSGQWRKPSAGVRASFFRQRNGLRFRATGDTELESYHREVTAEDCSFNSNQTKQVQTTVKMDFHINTTSQKLTLKLSSRPVVFQ